MSKIFHGWALIGLGSGFAAARCSKMASLIGLKTGAKAGLTFFFASLGVEPVAIRCIDPGDADD